MYFMSRWYMNLECTTANAGSHAGSHAGMNLIQLQNNKFINKSWGTGGGGTLDLA